MARMAAAPGTASARAECGGRRGSPGVELVADPFAGRAPRAVVADARGDRLVAVQERGAACYGAIVVSVPGDAGGCDSLRLVEERAVSTNTAAAGGNASLMAIG